jgi:hypothetical protein
MSLVFAVDFQKAPPPRLQKSSKASALLFDFGEQSVQPHRGSRGLKAIRTRDPILLPQRLRLLRAAKRVGGDAGTILGPGMSGEGRMGLVRAGGF